MTPSNEMKAEPGELESTVKPTQASSRGAAPVLMEKMPSSEAELEAFFAAAESKTLKSFTEKYEVPFSSQLFQFFLTIAS